MGATIAGRMRSSTAAVGRLTKSAKQDITGDDGAALDYEDAKNGSRLGWKRGVEWRPRYQAAHTYPGNAPRLPASTIDPDDWDEKVIDVPASEIQEANGGLHRVVPFLIYGSEGDSTLNQTTEARLMREADGIVELYGSHELAAHLWTGVAGTVGGSPYLPGNPSLVSQGVDITPTPGTPVSVVDAVAILLEQFGDDGWPGDVVFHCHRKLIPTGIHNVVFERDGAFYKALGSHIVIADTGYPGTAPAAFNSETEANETWLYATGPVEWDIERAVPTMAFKNSLYVNTLHARAESAGIVRFHGTKSSDDGLGPVAYAVLTTWRS